MINELVAENLDLVRTAVHRYKKSLPRSVDENGLFSAGQYGLWKAAQRFNPDLGEFRTFARPRIRGEMVDFVRRECQIPRFVDVDVAQPGAHDRVSESDLWEVVYRALRATDYRTNAMRNFRLLQMEFVEGKTPKEISSEMGISRIRFFQLRRTSFKALHWRLSSRK